MYVSACAEEEYSFICFVPAYDMYLIVRQKVYIYRSFETNNSFKKSNNVLNTLFSSKSWMTLCRWSGMGACAIRRNTCLCNIGGGWQSMYLKGTRKARWVTYYNLKNNIRVVIIGSIWPWWRARDASAITNEATSVSLINVGTVKDWFSRKAPMYFMGYLWGKPVYRTTNTLTTDKRRFSF